MARLRRASIEPRLLRGFRDYLPEQMIARQKILETIREVYERYGFLPLDTPALEYAEVLVGEYGEESSKQIFRFPFEEEELALRFDLTVPLARVVAQYRELPRPFRRYQVAPVWRVDKPGPGRFREFLQFDLDTVGSAEMAADAEIISGMYDTLQALGVERFRITYSDRKVLNSLLTFARVPAGLSHGVFRVIDKFERYGKEAVRQELTAGRKDASGDWISGLELPEAVVECLLEFLDLAFIPPQERLDSLAERFVGISGAEEGISELRTIGEYLKALGIPEDKVVLDLTIARGLDYYTGPVFEAVLLDAPEFGSVFGGGRYDQLVERFLGEKIPATGASIGVDRLLAALLKLGAIELVPSTAQILMTVMVRDRLTDYQRLTRELRQAGFKTELYLGGETSLAKQLQYADRQKIPVAVIAGPEEFDSGTISIKDLREGRRLGAGVKGREEWVKARVGQVTVPRAQLAEKLKEILGVP